MLGWILGVKIDRHVIWEAIVSQTKPAKERDEREQRQRMARSRQYEQEVNLEMDDLGKKDTTGPDGLARRRGHW